MWHGLFRVAEMCGDHAARLKMAGTPYRLFPVVHISKLKRVKVFPDRPYNSLTVEEGDRVDFDEAMLPEDSWERSLESDEFEVEKITDIRSDRKTRYGRIRRQFLMHCRVKSFTSL